jgi:methyltransferase (TIGR00027 family)
MTQTIQDVSDTAFMVAIFRALETERTEPLFRDPLASRLAGDHGRRILASVPRTFVGAWSVVIRTVIIDEFIQAAVAEGVDTVLNLGAGLDTRPYRMALPPSLHWIEVDYPHVIELKEARLVDERPSCRLDRIKLDLTDQSSRKRLFAEVSAPATKILVLTEGVVPYLTEGDVAELADDLRQVEKVCYWIIDYFSPEAIRYGQRMRARFMRNAPFRFAPKDWFSFFDRHGWKPTEIRYIADEAERLGLPIPLPLLLKLWVKLIGTFASRQRKERMKRFAAYVLLVPK